MAAFYYDTDKKLVEIFTEHCNLSGEQYEWIRGEFIYLVADIQDEEPGREIDERIRKMKTVFDFLLETKELTLKEHLDLHQMLDEMAEQAEKIRAEIIRKAVTEGTVL